MLTYIRESKLPQNAILAISKVCIPPGLVASKEVWFHQTPRCQCATWTRRTMACA